MNQWQKLPKTTVDALRHGACEGGEIFRGSTDVELSELGWKQMQASVKDKQWDQIISSPLKRCRLFSEQLADQLAIPLTIDDRWREFNFGAWEGRLREEVWAESGDQVKQFFGDPTSFTPEGGDSYASVCERVNEAWSEILDQHHGNRVLLVAHGGILRTLHAELKSLPSNSFNSIEIPYACLSRWTVYGRYESREKAQAMLSFHNYPSEFSEH